MWQAAPLSSVQSPGPHQVLIITPGSSDGIELFTVKNLLITLHRGTCRFTTGTVLNKRIHFWEWIHPAAAIISTCTNQEWQLPAYIYQNCYELLLLCIKITYLFLYPLVYPLFPPSFLQGSVFSWHVNGNQTSKRPVYTHPTFCPVALSERNFGKVETSAVLFYGVHICTVVNEM